MSAKIREKGNTFFSYYLRKRQAKSSYLFTRPSFIVQQKRGYLNLSTYCNSICSKTALKNTELLYNTRVKILFKKSNTTIAICGVAPCCINHCVCRGKAICHELRQEVVLEHMQISLRVFCIIKNDWTNHDVAGHDNPNGGLSSVTAFLHGSLSRFLPPKPHVVFSHSPVQMKISLV